MIGFANAGADTINGIKQAHEFGLVASGRRLVAPAFFITDVHALGLETAQGVLYSAPFYWDMNDQTRTWSRRFFDRLKKMPTNTQAGNYTALTHYLKAVKAAGTTDTEKVMEKIRSIPIDDFNTKGGQVRANGSIMRQRLVLQVKTPAESKAPWDYLRIVRTLSAEESAPPPVASSGCPFTKG